MSRSRLILTVPAFLATIALGLFAPPVESADYPSKPIRLIIPKGAGGGSDLGGRAIASVIDRYLGQPMYVQLQPGAGGRKGMLLAKRAKPDGYTLVLGAPSDLTTAPNVRDMGYDPLKDFVHIFRSDTTSFVLFANAKKGWKNFDEFVKAARKNPGQVSFASSGLYQSSHLMLLKIMTDMGIKLNHVPFGGGGPSFRAMLGGHADLTAITFAVAGGHVRSGKVVPLALAGNKRIKSHPKLPTLKEKGVNMTLLSWRVVMAPKGTPPDRVAILEEAFKKLVKDKTFKNLFKKLRFNIDPLYGPKLYKAIEDEYNSYGAILRGAGVEVKK